jgi:hypothetical protein
MPEVVANEPDGGSSSYPEPSCPETCVGSPGAANAVSATRQLLETHSIAAITRVLQLFAALNRLKYMTRRRNCPDDRGAPLMRVP